MTNSDLRLQHLNILANEYTFTIHPNKIKTWDKAFRINTNTAEQPYLQDDKNGNMQIFYPSITDNAGIEYYVTDKSFEFYIRRRWANPAEHGGARYSSPAGTGIKIFIPKNTLQKIRNKITIPILHIIEGEIKAIYADHYGIDCVGIAGIWMFIAAKESKNLHPTIKQIINDCKVNSLNLLQDGDCRQVTFDWEKEPNKDYSQRLEDFHNCVHRFKIACHNFNSERSKHNTADNPITPINYYYSHLLENEYKAKGIDDLIIAAKQPEIIEQISGELKKCKPGNNTYFKIQNLENMTKGELLEYFYLDTDKLDMPTGFYNKFEATIQDKKFWFFGNQYQYNDKEGRLEIKFHKDLNEYIRVGTNYYREIVKSRAINDKTNEQIIIKKKILKEWTKAEITLDYVAGKGIKNALHYIRKYTDFCNVPGHDDDFQKIIGNEYNLYHPTPYKPEKGEFPNIMRFLKHLFQNQYQDKLNIALDILQLKYTKPLVKLPITVLFSKEKNTGKSTFLWLLNEIYGDNAAIIGNKELEDNFSEYMFCNVLLMDEAVIDKTRTFEMVKSWTTQHEASMNLKGKTRQKVSFFASIFMTTNRINFVTIDDDENRFFIVKVPTINPDERDPNLLAKMKDEIPAFLYYLKYERQLHYPVNKDRFWFPSQDLETDTLKELKATSQKMTYKAFMAFCKEMFFQFEITEFEITATMLMQELRRYTTRDVGHTEILNLMKDDLKIIPGQVKKFKYPEWIEIADISGQRTHVVEWKSSYFDAKEKKMKQYVGSTYKLEAAKILSSEDYETLIKTINEKKFNEIAIFEKMPF